ncbi:regulatory protein RecX [Herbihabitans rhizosphaerae]|uniref:regulatory protein RecX n=1 Tax=Herbihabitans rhizosphaerae TaxID=1872711 RepID=UPI001F5F2828|nr:regulatory protein RecX [Herbihabitans rhizosphaerae]
MCYRLLTVRARTRLELEQALRSKGIPDDVAESTLGKFDRAGLIDDASFAETWVRSRHEYQGLGRRALKAELRRKGVTDDVAAEAVDMVDADAEEERARGLVRKKLRAMGAADEQTKVRRLVGMLARKGYSEGLSFRIVREELSYLDPETTLLDDTLIE